MKRLGWPLYVQFLAWGALNLLVLAAIAVAFTGRQGIGLEMLLTTPARERAQAQGDALSRELEAAPAATRPAIVAEFAQRHGLDVQIAPSRGPGPGPGPGPNRGPGFGGPPPGMDRGAPPPGFGPMPEPRRDPGPPPDGSFVRIERQGSQFLLRIPLAWRDVDGQRREAVLATDRLVMLLRFLGLSGWLGYLAAALIGSALLWWPFVASITRRIGHLTRVTEDIAQGRLERRTEPGRPDELGRLGASINTMTGRLQAQVEGQREFLMDVSHELASPLARVQVGLALAQQGAAPDVAHALAEVETDAGRMAELLQDLLQFSRSGTAARTPKLTRVDLRRLLETACLQEGAVGRARLAVPERLEAVADADLLLRAIANLVRNALRYGEGSTVEVGAHAAPGERVRITVADRGPGVAPEALQRLGEAFYRPDAARSSHSGGFGLGLAIAHRCAEACGGRLTFANRQGGGFEAAVELGGVSPFE